MTSIINSIGMTLIRIEPGSFVMGSTDGDLDERPPHQVTITQPFYMGITPVTNQQYEMFDPNHHRLRGRDGLSLEDDEAAVYVSWHDAVAFCDWLSRKEGRPYRLPTEAEWEYACRAGTTTAYSTGETFPETYHRNQHHLWAPVPVPLHVGRTPSNPWGLHDMHGIVEEWCLDWYGPYDSLDQIDPLGPETGTFKVTRGGSHSTSERYLRSANRSGTLPEDKHWLIGFRVVLGELPARKARPTPKDDRKLWSIGVSQTPAKWLPPSSETPSFFGPIPFVRRPAQPERVPMYRHNHQPAITWCNNGDLLAIWFSTEDEGGREMTVLASRLRSGASEWDEPSEFFKAPDRNMTGSALFNDGQGRLYHFNGLGTDGTWGKLAVTMRTSTDHGATWSIPRLIVPDHGFGRQVIAGVSQTREGWLLLPCDAVSGGDGGTVLHISRDGGETWEEPSRRAPTPVFREGGTGAWIAGIHAGVVQRRDGSLLALGRGDDIDGRMPMSISHDMGQSWHYSASEFPRIRSGQRLVLIRLREQVADAGSDPCSHPSSESSSDLPSADAPQRGPLLLVSFTDPSDRRDQPQGLLARDAHGRPNTVYGMFAALSYDDGETWPVKKVIANPELRGEYDGGAWTGAFHMDATHGEPMGYLAATQTPDGFIHLVSSALYYRFNLAWLLHEA